MYYCFVDCDLENHNEFVIQATYSKKLKKYLCYVKSQEIIVDENNNEIDVGGLLIFLRCSYDLFENISRKLVAKGVKLIEDINEREKIENWYRLGICKREIYETKVSSLLKKNTGDEIENFLRNNERIFLKTKRKDVSVKINSQDLLLMNDSTKNIFYRLFYKEDSELLLSKEYKLKKDSIGNKEVRFFIFNNEIINFSRNVHSLMHIVPKSLKKEATKIVDTLSFLKDFPDNYVLDLCIFKDENFEFVDIVEINPISCSLCYVNNSIFTNTFEGINEINKSTKMGYEYCYDYLINSDKYTNEKFANEKYNYYSESEYVF